jgi:hypothetical protein
MNSWTVSKELPLDRFLCRAINIAKGRATGPLTYEFMEEVIAASTWLPAEWTLKELTMFSLDVNFWLNRVKSRMGMFKAEQIKVVACPEPPYQIHVKGHGESLYVIKVNRDGEYELTYECGQQGCTIWHGNIEWLGQMFAEWVAFELRNDHVHQFETTRQ